MPVTQVLTLGMQAGAISTCSDVPWGRPELATNRKQQKAGITTSWISPAERSGHASILNEETLISPQRSRCVMELSSNARLAPRALYLRAPVTQYPLAWVSTEQRKTDRTCLPRPSVARDEIGLGANLAAFVAVGKGDPHSALPLT